MSTFLKDFYFPLLDDPEFREDSVREELISPLLKCLGYASFGSCSIRRSKRLLHPFVYIGTKPHKVHIIPDYTVYVDDKPSWILDAKAPSEDIRQGKHREQAYSYAIHKDIRVSLYALCNGRRFIVYHISEENPIIDCSLNELTESFDDLWKVISPEAIRNPAIVEFWPDLGVHYFILGCTPADSIISIAYIDLIMRIDEDNYTIAAGSDVDGIDMIGSYDFNNDKLPELLSILPIEISQKVKQDLRRHPFQSDLRQLRPLIKIYVRMGLNLVNNSDETFLPFIVKRFASVSPADLDQANAS